MISRGDQTGKRSSLEIRLLGAFRVVVDGEPVPDSQWRQRKAVLLLQRLALEPHHRIHSEQLMEMLWPGADADSSRNSLHKTIHMVRSALEPDLRKPADSHFLHTRGQQVMLTAGTVVIDTDVFEAKAAEAMRLGAPAAFEAALALYAGPLLPEEPYEELVAEHRLRLAGTYQQLLVELGRIHEKRGDPDRAIDVLSRLVRSDPANEAAHRSLMRLYAATGRRQMALRQYRECCDALKHELDAVPERVTTDLYQQIAAGKQQAEAPAAPRIAVVPFENMTGDAELDYLSDGMTESILASLARLPRLHVMAHSTVAPHRQREPRDVALALGVAFVVTGRIVQTRDRLVVRVELIDSSGARVWGGEYASLATVHEEISSAIAEHLGVTRKRRRVHSDNPEAYRLYLRGRFFWNKRSLDGVMKSIDCYSQAIDVDPECAPAWIGLADSYTRLGDVGVAASPPKEAFSKAKIAAIRAVEIDSSLAEGHTSLAHLFMHEYEWDEAEREFQSSLQSNPNYVYCRHCLAYQRMMKGRKSEAFEEIALALEIDPLLLPVNEAYAELLYFSRDYAAAVKQYQRTLELDPHFYPAQFGLAHVLLELGEHDQAFAAFERARELSGGTDVGAAIARAETIAGKTDSARRRLASLKRESRYVSPYGIATVHAAMGEIDEAFEWLSRACSEQAAWAIYVSVDPRVDPLRKDPRFAAILRGVHP